MPVTFFTLNSNLFFVTFFFVRTPEQGSIRPTYSFVHMALTMSIAEKAATTRSRPVRAAQIQRGIYALEKVKSQTTYIVSATKPGHRFELNEVRTGKSENYEPVSGNKWGVDFVAGGPSPHPSGSMENFETNDFKNLPWEHEGDSYWSTTSSEKHSGIYSAQAGSIDHDESTSLKVTLNCAAGDITFYSKTSSEGGCDYLKFYINGVEKRKWSGTNDWAEVSFPVTAGTRTFEWTYSKDGSVSRGDDTAWIDDIAFPVDSGL